MTHTFNRGMQEAEASRSPWVWNRSSPSLHSEILSQKSSYRRQTSPSMTATSSFQLQILPSVGTTGIYQDTWHLAFLSFLYFSIYTNLTSSLSCQPCDPLPRTHQEDDQLTPSRQLSTQERERMQDWDLSGWKDDSTAKGTYQMPRLRAGAYPWDPHGRQRELVPTNCPDLYTLCSVCTLILGYFPPPRPFSVFPYKNKQEP